MFIAELWRYPIKSMAGERLDSVEVSEIGLSGDRVVQVYNGQRIVTARSHPGLLAHSGSLGTDGTPLVDGRPWMDASVLADVRRIAGPRAELLRFDGEERFDVLPLLVATDGAIAAFGRDGRRLRPNIVIGGVAGLAERDWEGRHLISGKVTIRIDSLRGRCVMTTFDPDTQQQDPEVLRDIVRRFGGRLALNGEVLTGGTLRVGQDVQVVE